LQVAAIDFVVVAERIDVVAGLDLLLAIQPLPEQDGLPRDVDPGSAAEAYVDPITVGHDLDPEHLLEQSLVEHVPLDLEGSLHPVQLVTFAIHSCFEVVVE